MEVEIPESWKDTEELQEGCEQVSRDRLSWTVPAGEWKRSVEERVKSWVSLGWG